MNGIKDQTNSAADMTGRPADAMKQGDTLEADSELMEMNAAMLVLSRLSTADTSSERYRNDLSELGEQMDRIDVIPDLFLDETGAVAILASQLPSADANALPLLLQIIHRLVSTSGLACSQLMAWDGFDFLVSLLRTPSAFQIGVMSIVEQIIEYDSCSEVQVRLLKEVMLLRSPADQKMFEVFSAFVRSHDRDAVREFVGDILLRAITVWNGDEGADLVPVALSLLMDLCEKSFAEEVAGGVCFAGLVARFRDRRFAGCLPLMFRLAAQLVLQNEGNIERVPIAWVMSQLRAEHWNPMTAGVFELLSAIAKQGGIWDICDDGGEDILIELAAEGGFSMREALLKMCWAGFVGLPDSCERLGFINSDVFVVMVAECPDESVIPQVLTHLAIIRETIPLGETEDAIGDETIMSVLEFLYNLLDDDNLSDLVKKRVSLVRMMYERQPE